MFMDATPFLLIFTTTPSNTYVIERCSTGSYRQQPGYPGTLKVEKVEYHSHKLYSQFISFIVYNCFIVYDSDINCYINITHNETQTVVAVKFSCATYNVARGNSTDNHKTGCVSAEKYTNHLSLLAMSDNSDDIDNSMNRLSVSGKCTHVQTHILIILFIIHLMRAAFHLERANVLWHINPNILAFAHFPLGSAGMRISRTNSSYSAVEEEVELLEETDTHTHTRDVEMEEEDDGPPSTPPRPLITPIGDLPPLPPSPILDEVEVVESVAETGIPTPPSREEVGEESPLKKKHKKRRKLISDYPEDKVEGARAARRARNKRKKENKRAREALLSAPSRSPSDANCPSASDGSPTLSPPPKAHKRAEVGLNPESRDPRRTSGNLPAYRDLGGGSGVRAVPRQGSDTPAVGQPQKRGRSPGGDVAPKRGGRDGPTHTHKRGSEKTPGKPHGRGGGNNRGRGYGNNRGRGRGSNRGRGGNQGPSKGPATRKTPEQVIDRGEAKFVLDITKTGVSGRDLVGEVQRILFAVPEDIIISQLESVGTGRARVSTHNEASSEVLRSVLTSRGYGVSTPRPTWRRYIFTVPGELASLSPTLITEQLGIRNRFCGFPQGTLRYVNVLREEGEGSGHTQGRNPTSGRTRIWVDVSPEGEAFLEEHEFVLATLTGGVRLWPARQGTQTPRSRNTTDQSK